MNQIRIVKVFKFKNNELHEIITKIKIMRLNIRMNHKMIKFIHLFKNIKKKFYLTSYLI